jgi:AcrR family transcriptional regulator
MSPRPYRSAVRERSAATTRSAILDAAEALFAEHGYARVTIGRIAQEAGVAPGTVYSAFGNKPGLILGLTERATGDDTIGEALSAVAAADDGPQIVALTVDSTGDVVRRHRLFLTVLIDNAAVEPAIGELLKGTQALLHERYGLIAARLGEVGALREGLGVDEATRVLEYFLSPEPWLRLRALGWSWRDGGRWLEQQLRFALLGTADGAHSV